MRRVLFFAAILCLFSVSALCAPYWGKEFEFHQPDGSPIAVRVWGDEFYIRAETLDGYSLVRDPVSGFICYAEVNNDGSDFISTGIPYTGQIVEKLKSSELLSLAQGNGIKKGLRLKHQAVIEKADRNRLLLGRDQLGRILPAPDSDAFPAASAQADSPAPLIGQVVGLTLLIQFPDVPATIPQANINNYCNQVGYTDYGNNGSVRDYFYDVSNGNLTYTNYVTVYYTAQHNRSYYTDPSISYGTRARELIKEALLWLDDPSGQNFNFGTISTDSSNYMLAINAFYAGKIQNNWAEGFWPHMSSMYGMFTSNEGVKAGVYQITNIGSSLALGTFCHENGHMICDYPDLYDYGYESYGVGNYCLMASGGSDYNPIPPNPYLRDIKGWENVTEFPSTSGLQYFLQSNSNTSYKYPNPDNSHESFYIENRTRTGRNSSLPDEGLVIWHIDEDGSNDNEQMTPSLHYMVSVEQADGLFHLESNINAGGSGDLFHAGDKDVFKDTTVPNATWWNGANSNLVIQQISAAGASMSFVYNNLTVSLPPVAQDGSAGTQINTSIPITLVATDDDLPNPPGALTYIITSLPSNGVLSDPGNGVISSVPYSLLGYGNQVVYAPDTSFTGFDSFQFKANDGGTAPDGGDSNPATVSVTVSDSTIIFSEDFESGLGGFVIDNRFGNGNGLWHLSTVCNAALPGHTEPTALFYGLDGSCTYNNGLTNQGVVISPSISLAGFPTGLIELRLKYFLKTEGLPTDYDKVTIEISENSGPFTLISYNNTTPEPVTLTDPSITWLETVIDLSAFAGSSIQLRFGFNSVDSALNNYAGFYVDDVTITENGSIPLPGQAASPEPANAATNVSLTNDLSWTAGSGATSHNIYFGTTSPGTFRGNQAGTTYDTGRMTPGTTYYWRVDEKNTYGTTTGMVWSFTTAVSEVWQSESVNWRVDYGDNWNKTGTVTKPGATAIRLHFSTIDIESGWDHLYSDAGDNWSGTYTDVTSGENSGDSITLTLTSDTSVTEYFIIDRVDYQGTSAGPTAASGELFWDNGSGDIIYDFDDVLYIWDISGSYSNSIDSSIVFDIDYTMTQDTGGKITGYGNAQASVDTDYGIADIDIPFDVKGSVSQKNGTAFVKLSFKGKGTVSLDGESFNVNWSSTIKAIIDPASNEITGEVKVRLSSARETVPFTQPLQDDMDGSAILSISCAPSGRNLLGTGELTLSNDDTYNFGVKGTYNVKKDESSLTLKGDAKRNSLKMKIDGSDGRINSLNGKVLGQVLKAIDIMPMP